jgi:hypothetical protein
LHGFLRFFLQIWQLKIFEDKCGDFVDVYFGFVVVGALGPDRACPEPVPEPGRVSRPITSPTRVLPSPWPTCFAFWMIKAKLVFVESFDRDFDGALAVREDDGFVRDDRSEVLADCFLYAILVTLLIDDALALK